MITIKYQQLELRDLLEHLLGENPRTLLSETAELTSRELQVRIRNLNILVVPQDYKDSGLYQGGLVVLKLQGSRTEILKTTIHETIHHLKPRWYEPKVEKVTQEIHTGAFGQSLRI